MTGSKRPRTVFDLAQNAKIITDIEKRMASSDFWQDQEAAKAASQKLAQLKEEREKWARIDSSLALLREESEKITDETEIQQRFEKQLRALEKEISEEEIKTFFRGPYDKNNAILAIHAGQGGVEAMDWAEILERMYLRFCERKNWQTDVVDLTPGEEAGIKNVTITISGPYAYGYLKGEAGVHRLVRQSPFNADRLRQT